MLPGVQRSAAQGSLCGAACPPRAAGGTPCYTAAALVSQPLLLLREEIKNSNSQTRGALSRAPCTGRVHVLVLITAAVQTGSAGGAQCQPEAAFTAPPTGNESPLPPEVRTALYLDVSVENEVFQSTLKGHPTFKDVEEEKITKILCLSVLDFRFLSTADFKPFLKRGKCKREFSTL